MRSLPQATQPASSVTAAIASSRSPKSVMTGISSRMVAMPSAPPINAPDTRSTALCAVSPTVPRETKKHVTTQVWISGQSSRLSAA